MTSHSIFRTNVSTTKHEICFMCVYLERISHQNQVYFKRLGIVLRYIYLLLLLFYCYKPHFFLTFLYFFEKDARNDAVEVKREDWKMECCTVGPNVSFTFGNHGFVQKSSSWVFFKECCSNSSSCVFFWNNLVYSFKKAPLITLYVDQFSTLTENHSFKVTETSCYHKTFIF